MTILTIATNANSIAAQFSQLSGERINRAMRFAFNKTADRVWTQSKREIAKEVKLPQWVIARRIRQTRASLRRGYAELIYELKGIPFAQLAQFFHPVGRGVIVGNRYFKGMFIAQVGGGAPTHGHYGGVEQGGHVGIFVRHEKSKKRRSVDMRRVRPRQKFSGRKNKYPGRMYKASLPIKEPIKFLTFMIPKIAVLARKIVREQFPPLFEHELNRQVAALSAMTARRSARP